MGCDLGPREPGRVSIDRVNEGFGRFILAVSPEGEMLLEDGGWINAGKIGSGPGPAHKDPSTGSLIVVVGN